MNDEKDSQLNDLSEDLNTLQQLMIENTLSIKKQLSSTVLPLISAVAVIAIILLGLLVNVSTLFTNILAAIIFVAIASFLFLFRHLFYVRSTDNVIEFLSTGSPLKEGRSIPYINKIFTFLQPQEIYELVKESLEDEWSDLFPLFEKELQQIDESKIEVEK